MRIFTSSILVVSLVISYASFATAKEGETAKILRIIDGDTLEVQIGTKKEKVRIIGIDTPEIVDTRTGVQCFGKEASSKLKALIGGKTVSLVANPAEDKDIYKRLLRYVEVNGKDIGASIIADGYAYSYRKYPHPRLDTYNALEKKAREGNKGLWGSCSTSSASSKTKSSSSKAMNSVTSSKANCTIKGNISTEKIYHVKGCKSYDSTQIDIGAGEQWFCSESEAKAAGFRKAKNCSK